MTAPRTRTPVARRSRNERGYALVLLAFTLTVMMAMAGFSVDVGAWYYTAGREQKAADAAALSGVVYLPESVVAGNDSYDKAVQAANGNGFASGVTVTQVVGNPNQLQVTVSQTVRNSFAGLVGYNLQTISRTAIAEYEAPVAMGSPTNVFGTEPIAGTDSAWANAVFTPNLWGNVYGPGKPKANGDAIMSNNCDAISQDECGSGTTNLDFNPDGYFYRVNMSAAKRPSGALLAIEVYDPAAVNVGDHCAQASSGIENAATIKNTYVPTKAEAAVRYAWGDTSAPVGPQGGTWCNGDNGTATTSYVVRQDTNPYQPPNNPVVSTDGCAGEQFGSWDPTVSGNLGSLLDKTSGSYDDHLAQVFRQWVPICVFDPSTQPANDYLVQIRTDIAPTSSQAAMAQEPAPTPYATDQGGNRFSIRAAWVTAGAGTVWTAATPNANPKRSAGDPYIGGYPVAPARPAVVSGGSAVFGAGLSISGLRYMSLYANAASGITPTYYMARVLPSGTSQTLEIRLWDVGDCGGGSCAPTLTFHYPPSFGSGGIPLCTWKVHDGSPGLGTGAAQQTIFSNQSCTYTVGTSSENQNGAWYTVDIAIPSSYSCTAATATDCWITMAYHANGAGSSLADTTTWGGQLQGSPVRLVR